MPGVSVGSELESYRLLAETAQLLLARGGLDEVLGRVAEALKTLLAYDGLTIFVVERERRLCRPVLSRDAWADQIMSEPLPFGEGGVGWVAEHREPIRLAWDQMDDPRLRHVPGTPDDPEAMLAMPLISRGELVGVLVLYRQGEASFSVDDQALAKLFADQAALAIDNAHAHDLLEARAKTDSVTDLFNHRHFHEQLRAELNRGHRYHTPVSLVLLDLDDFKRVNDRYGHLEGDEVLRQLGGVIKAELRSQDVACRIGGEEFGLILPHTDAAGARELAERVRHVAEATAFGRAGSLTISAGIAEMPRDASAATALIEFADAALYRSKHAGKNRVTEYGAEDGDQVAADIGDQHEHAELAVLQSLARRVVTLGEPKRIAETIAVELRTVIDYHHCRVLLVDETGEWLVPIASYGDLFQAGRRRPTLRQPVGLGVTGAAVAAGRSLIVDDALRHPSVAPLPGTPAIEESLLAVPMRYDQRTIGVIVLSKLGRGQFGHGDLRLVEILASQAAVAFENAALEARRRRAETRTAALLKLTGDNIALASLRTRLKLVRQTLACDWTVLLRAEQPGDELVAVEISAGRASTTRALLGLRLQPRLDAVRLSRPSADERRRLPPQVRASRCVRHALDPDTVLLAGFATADAEREARTMLRELSTRLGRMMGASPAIVPSPAPSARASAVRRRVGRLSAELPAGLSRTKLLRVLADHAIRLSGADAASIALLDDRTNTVRYTVMAGVELDSLAEIAFPTHSTVVGEAIASHRIVVVDDYRRHPLAHPIFLEAGIRSIAVVPMMIGGRISGAVSALSVNRPLRFASSQIAILEVVAQQAGALIAQDELYEELESSYRATVEALTNALEVKDAYTSEHVRQIAELAAGLGRSLRLGTRRLRDLEYAAILHDIGKIGVPTAILTKPGPLDAAERVAVEKHAEMGYSLLRDIPFLARVAEIVRASHERWDGAGYPLGLDGEHIPLEARIILVCDAWHAMRSDRPYRAALDFETARDRLLEGAGSQFDPRVVDVFLRQIDATRLAS